MSRRAISAADYTIRSCVTHDELAACVTLQKQIWGYSDLEVYPLRLFVNLGQIGGQVIGAFAPGGEMVGFVASLPAWRNGRSYYHSLSLGVLPGHENRGLGRALKLEQRRRALRSGIEWIEWTFDPLRAKNAFFNIVRLGAVCGRYDPNHYGPVDSRLQRGLPSDRLVAEWWLRSARVRRALAGKPVRAARRPAAAEIEIPVRRDTGKKAPRGWTRALLQTVRGCFQEYFERGLVVTGFVVEGSTARYLLDPAE
jgi:predicted GNAT superfamily acetyltransferase